MVERVYKRCRRRLKNSPAQSVSQSQSQLVSQSEREKEREREFCSLLQAALPLLGPLGPRSSDLMNRADRTISRSPAEIGEWRSGTLGGALCIEMVFALSR